MSCNYEIHSALLLIRFGFVDFHPVRVFHVIFGVPYAVCFSDFISTAYLIDFAHYWAIELTNLEINLRTFKAIAMPPLQLKGPHELSSRHYSFSLLLCQMSTTNYYSVSFSPQYGTLNRVSTFFLT